MGSRAWLPEPNQGLMQFVDALVDAMDARGLRPRVSFKLDSTRVYVGRKLGIPAFDDKRLVYDRAYAYYLYRPRLAARKEYDPDLPPNHYTSFEIEGAHMDDALLAWDRLRPLIRAVVHHRPEPPEELMSLF